MTFPSTNTIVMVDIQPSNSTVVPLRVRVPSNNGVVMVTARRHRVLSNSTIVVVTFPLLMGLIA